MRTGRLFPVLAVVVAASCGGGDGSEGLASSSTPPSETATPPATTVPLDPLDASATSEPAPPAATPPAPTDPPAASALPDSWLRYGADGLFLVDTDGEQLIVDRPIGWATSDGAGGALFTEWNPHRFGPTWWLPGGSSDPDVVSEWDDPLLAALVDGRPAAVGPLATDECGSDGVGHMVAHLLVTGEEVALQCGVGGPDAGREANSFGGGLYVGVEWDAVHSSGRSTAVGLVFRDAAGDVVELPTNPYAGDCSPCELAAALSPDGTRLAVVHRPDAPPFRPEGWDAWLASTVSVEAELRIIDLATGESLFARALPAGVRPARGSWFDGRLVAVGPDAFAHPWLEPGDRGDTVGSLQQLLVAGGAEIEVDGIFGPATRDAVEAFHIDRFGMTRSTVGPDTWAELGLPTTIIDTETGTATELAGRVALEVILANDPPPGVVWTAAPPDQVELEEIAILRADGIGPFPFGTDADEVEVWLVEQFGDPDAAIVEAGGLGWPLSSCTERRFAYWAAAGLTVGFTDRNGYDSTGTIPDCAGAPFLTGWYVVDEGPPWFAPDHGEPRVTPIGLRLSSEDGIGLGATAGDLRAAVPGLEFGDWDIDEYVPAMFRMPDGMSGRGAWDPVADVQRALNDRGAALVVDGTRGPRTDAALAEFQSANGIDEYGIGPRTLAALGVDVPDDAPIVYVSAGRWEWYF